MCRSFPWVVVLGLLVLPCSAAPDDAPSVAIDAPSGQKAGATGPVALISGTARNVDTLIVGLTTEGATQRFEMVPGRRLVFVAQPEIRFRRRVAWPDEQAADPSSSDATPRSPGLEARVEILGWTHAATFPSDEDSVALLDPDAIEGNSLAQIVRRMESTAPGAIRFLIQVLPAARYRRMLDGALPPRLTGEGSAPWPGSVEAFEAFKQQEVEAYVSAGRAGKPYVPTRDRFLVLPRSEAAADTASVEDFDVLEWPTDAAFRADGSWFVHPTVARGMTGRPVVVFDVAEERQEAFETWTRQNIGLPMALVVDGRVQSAPVINSPLRDSVQITLGSGQDAVAARTEAESLAAALAGGPKTRPGGLIAAATWEKDGTFEIAVLPRGKEVVVSLQGVTAAAGVSSPVLTRTVVSRPDGETDAGARVKAVLAAEALGMVGVEEGAALLEGLGAFGLEALAASPREHSLAWKLAVRLDPTSDITWQMLRRAVEEEDADGRAEAAGSMLTPEARTAEAWSLLLPKALDDPRGVAQALSNRVIVDVPRALAILGEEAQAKDPRRRVLAAWLLRMARGDAAGKIILGLLGDDEETVRRAALQSLAFWQQLDSNDLPQHALDEVLKRLDAEHAEARVWAAGFLGTRGDIGRAHAGKLRALLDDPDGVVRTAAAWALLELGIQDEKAERIFEEAKAKAVAEAEARAKEAAR